MKPYRLLTHKHSRRRVSPVHDYVARTKAGRIAFIVAVLIVANVGLCVRFSHKTYPRTSIGGHALGSAPCDQIPQKAGAMPLLPSTLELTYKKQTTKIDPRNLGVSPNLPAIAESCQQDHSWVPLVSVLLPHDLPAAMHIHDTTFRVGFETVKKDFEKQASKAQLVIEKGLFVLKPSAKGVTINEASFKGALLEALVAGEHKLELPVAITEPEQTQLDQEYSWQQLVKQQNTAITFYFGGKTKQLTAEEVVLWYVPDKRSYSPSADKIRATVVKIGKDAKLDLTNIDQAVAAVQDALQTHNSLAFSLLGPPTP